MLNAEKPQNGFIGRFLGISFSAGLRPIDKKDRHVCLQGDLPPSTSSQLIQYAVRKNNTPIKELFGMLLHTQ